MVAAKPRKKYKKIRYADRQAIELLCSQNKTVEEIAHIIGVHSSTMYRELAKGGTPYSATTAQRNV